MSLRQLRSEFFESQASVEAVIEIRPTSQYGFVKTVTSIDPHQQTAQDSFAEHLIGRRYQVEGHDLGNGVNGGPYSW